MGLWARERTERESTRPAPGIRRGSAVRGDGLEGRGSGFEGRSSGFGGRSSGDEGWGSGFEGRGGYTEVGREIDG